MKQTIFQNSNCDIIFKVDEELSSAPGEDIQIKSIDYHIDSRKTFVDHLGNIAYVLIVSKK